MMSFDDMEGMDLEALAHPQEMFKGLREMGGPIDMVEDMNMFVVGTAEHIREVLMHPDVYSSGVEAVQIGQVRPLIPLQIDPPQHKYFRRLLDPIFGRETIARIEPETRRLIKLLIDKVKDSGGCNFHEAIAEPLPSTVFLQLLGLPVDRTKEFIALKDGIIRPPAHDNTERVAMVNE